VLPEVELASGYLQPNQSQREGSIKRAPCDAGWRMREGRLNSVALHINSAESGSMAKTDNRYTAVQMEEKKSKEQREHDLEEPFNEEFWLKVRFLLLTSSISALLQIVLIFTKCDLSIIFLDISMTCSFILFAKL